MLRNIFITKNSFSILISVFILLLISGLVFCKAVNYKTVMVEDLLFSSKYYEQFQDKSIIKKIFTTSVYFDKVKYLYRPVFIFSFYIDSKISSGKVNLKVNHITSLLLHLFCVLMFFYFLIKYCDFKPYLALIGSLFFSINIFSVWSAVWLSGRCDLLLFFFAFLAFILFMKSNETENVLLKNIFLILHFVLFLLALLSKETAVVLPAVCLMFVYVKGYKLRLSYLCYILIYTLYSMMYSNDVNIVKQFIGLFDIKNIFYMICYYLSAPFFYLSGPKVVSPYNSLTLFEGIIVILFFVVAVKNSKEKKIILFYLLFASLFFLPTILGKRISFQGNRMYLPMAGLIIAVLYIIDEFYKKNINNIKTKICTIFLMVFITANIVVTNNAMAFAYDDDSIIKVIFDESKTYPKSNGEIMSLMYFLIGYYNSYGYSEQAKNIKNKFFEYSFIDYKNNKQFSDAGGGGGN